MAAASRSGLWVASMYALLIADTPNCRQRMGHEYVDCCIMNAMLSQVMTATEAGDIHIYIPRKPPPEVSYIKSYSE